MWDVTVGLASVAVVAASTWYFRRYKNLPPGPSGWPIFGHLLNVSANPKVHEYYKEQAEKYGDIYTLWFGSHPAIFLSGPDMIKEAFVKNADYFSGRPDWLCLVKRFSENKGVIWSVHNWKNARKFALTAMKDFGLGKSSLEEKMQMEVNALVEEMEKAEGEEMGVHNLLQNAVSNIICSIVFGTRFSYDDPEFKQVMDQFNILFSGNNIMSAPNFIWWMAPPLLFLGKGRITRGKKALDSVQDFIRSKIRQHEETYDKDNIRDFLDLFIQSSRNGSTEFGNISEQDAFRIIFDLFAAGTETTSTTLQWLIAFMINYPDVQARCRQEIHQVVGSERLPTLKDRDSLVYTNATLLEVQRVGCIATNSLPHTCSKDVEIGGYRVPKDSVVIANIYATHFNPKYFPEPEVFNPDRWIGQDGKLLKNAAFLPFSIGRRVCLGEQLAKNEILLFGVSLLQRFEFKQAGELPSLEGNISLTHAPPPFKIRALRV